MECIIQAFPDEYNIQCMDEILKSATHLNETVDVRELFIFLNSREKVQILLGYIRPLLEDSTDTIEVDAYQFE